MCFVCDFRAIWGFHINNECPNCECIERIAGAGLKQYAGRIQPPGRILPMYDLVHTLHWFQPAPNLLYFFYWFCPAQKILSFQRFFSHLLLSQPVHQPRLCWFPPPLWIFLHLLHHAAWMHLGSSFVLAKGSSGLHLSPPTLQLHQAPSVLTLCCAPSFL